MEVFRAFAALSLTDLISGPLRGIRAALNATEASTLSLGQRMGRLALAMAPVAIGAGVLLGAFGACAARAMTFESAMADVAKVVNFAGQAEFKAMGDTVMDLAGRLPMAQEGIAAIIAAAGQSGVAKADLAEFAEQAAKMGIAFDLTGDQAGKMMADWRAGMDLSLPRVYALADAVNHLSNNMNATAPALGEVIQRAGALAMSCGLAETEVAALGTAFLSAGASPEIAATAMKKFVGVLSRGDAMSKRARESFAELGLSSAQLAKDMQSDAKGTMFKVLQALAAKPKETQIGLLTEMFGEESIGAIAPLLANMGNLTQAFELVGDATAYAGSMQAEFEARSKTTENALQLMRNRLANLSIAVGTAFLPAIGWAADKIGQVADALRSAASTPFGQTVLKAAGALSVAVVGATALSGALWGLSKAGPALFKVLAPLKAAVLGLGAPVLAVAAVIGLLYAAYRTNFGGIADIVDRWYNNIKLVFNGVAAVFESLSGTTGTISGKLAQDIRDAGLEDAVTWVGKIVYRIKSFFEGLRETFDISPAIAALTPAVLKLRSVFDTLSAAFARLFGTEVTSATAGFTGFGQVVGTIASFVLEGFATAINLAASAISVIVDWIRMIVALFTGDWATACDAAKSIWDTLVSAFMSIADLFGIGDWLRAAWADALAYLESINLYECGARILETLKEGVLSAASSVKDSVTGVFQSIRDLLPFSDAKEGPLSQLTLSGSRMMTTLGEGILSGASTLKNIFAGALRFITPDTPPIADPDLRTRRANADAGAGDRGKSITINIGTITLPDIGDAEGFIGALEGMVDEYGGAPA
jgi:TP901 family phage tail tape measure protein